MNEETASRRYGFSCFMLVPLMFRQTPTAGQVLRQKNLRRGSDLFLEQGGQTLDRLGPRAALAPGIE